VATHAACGVPLDAAGHCPACLMAPSPAHVDVRLGPGLGPAVREDAVSRALRRPHRLLTPLLDDGTARST